MPKKPVQLIYGVDDKPPAFASFMLGLQHIFTMASTLVLPVIIVKEIGGSFLQIQSMLGFSMLAIGIGTILQSLKKGPIGSGYLCPHLSSPSYLSVSIQAAWLGGLPLLHGMLLIAGFFEIIFSKIVNKLKFLFPPGVTGVVVLMVGVSLVPLGASKFMGIEYMGDPLQYKYLLVSSITLFSMIGFNIWSKGKLRLYCVLIGLLIGYIVSSLSGVLTSTDWSRIIHASFFSLPGKGARMFHWSFDWSLLIPFIIVTICGSLKSVGNILTCQKINDADWKTADMKNVGKGLMAEGIGIMVAGFLGGTATDTSSSNIGLSVATGATSRRIGTIAGLLFVFLAFLPKLTAVLSIMPVPVMGAILIFVTSFVIIAGLQIIMIRPISSRVGFVVGISFIFGLSLEIIPGLYKDIYPWLRPFFSSSLTFSTILAIVLNQIFRIGEKNQA
jgi:xanthine permease XanP